jgi:DNA-binding NtrC family response regulator
MLRIAVERAVAQRRLRREVRRLRGVLAGRTYEGPIIGERRIMRDVLGLVARLAKTGSSVLVTGESGTGKELVARALHDQSHAVGHFVAVNCAAIPEQLIESELFGHEKSAFTDAKNAREGLFSRLAVALCCWTRLVSCRPDFSPSYCGRFKSEPFVRLAAAGTFLSTRGSLPRQIAI